MPGGRSTSSPFYPTPTAVSGSLKALSNTASTATSNTKINVPALTAINTSYRFIPENATGTTGTKPAAGVAFDNVNGWQDTNNFASAGEVALVDAQTVNVVVNLQASAAAGCIIDVVLYAGGVQLGQGTLTNSGTNVQTTATQLTVPVTIPSDVTIPANAKLQMAVFVTTSNINPVSALTITMNYNTTGTRIPAGITYALRPVRSVSDSYPSSDVTTRMQSAARTAPDSATATDTPNRGVVQFRRTTSDAPITSDTIARAYVGFRSMVESAVASEAVTRVLAQFRTIAQAATATETLARVVQRVRATDDAVSLIESTTRTFLATRLISQATSLVETLTRVAMFNRTSSDTVTGADSTMRALTFGRFVDDGLADKPVRFPGKWINGVTKDYTGSVLGACIVKLFRQRDDFLCQVTLSDPDTGAYAFDRDLFDSEAYYVLSYKSGVPEVHGVSDRGNVPHA